MKIDKKFNRFSMSEYRHYISNYKKYTNFNTLGLYRSILENKKLSVEEKIEIRDFANSYFQKTFDFLQIKDCFTYFNLLTLGKELTVADECHLFDVIRKNQELILKSKRIKHRNFGNYSKHNCANDNCYLNGLMIKKGSWFSEDIMHFDSDKRCYDKSISSTVREKSKKNKKDRKSLKRIILDKID